jgi:hypothetical protein
MAHFFGIAGLMTICYIIQDATPQLAKHFDNDNRFIVKLILSPLILVWYLCMIFSMPILLYMKWHDSRMEKVHKQIFLEDHKEHIDSLNNIIDRLSPPKK